MKRNIAAFVFLSIVLCTFAFLPVHGIPLATNELPAKVVSSCGGLSLAAGAPYYLTVDQTGVACVNASLGSLSLSGSSATIGFVKLLDANGTNILASTDPTTGTLTTPANGVVASTTLVKIITKSTGKKNYIAQLYATNDGAGVAHFSLIEGTQTTNPCDTGAVALIGDASTASNGQSLAASGGGFVLSKLIAGQAVTKDVCIQNDGTNSVRVHVDFVQQ